MRISVIGSSGAGKTTFGRAVAARLGLPLIELDSIYHQPGWTPLPEDAFRRAVAEVVAAEGWVIDGNYSAVRPLVLARADAVVWLDYPRRLIMRRVIWRSVGRAVTREELWNGNRESVRAWADADHPIRWAWSQHDRKRLEYEQRFASEYRHVTLHRLRRPAEARAWLRSLPA